MQTWRWTELLQMLAVTVIHSYSHVGSRALDEVGGAEIAGVEKYGKPKVPVI